VILWGGLTGNIEIPANSSRETWAYDVAANQWTLMKPATGPKGGAPSLAYDSESDRVILFGAIPFGENWKTSNMSQTWAYDYNTDTWTKMADGPVKHLGARIAYDTQSDRVILFGGLNPSSYFVYDDTWAYDFNSDTWTEMKPSTSPPGTNYQALAYDSKADRVLMYGGSDNNGKFLFSVWAYNFNTNTWQEMLPGEQPSPESREYPVMVYDAESDRTILFGGDYDYIKEGEIWTYAYSTNTWARFDSSLGPGDRSRHGMAYSSAVDRVILFGGQVDNTQFNYTNEIWTYDINTNTWTNMTSQ
jgi:N-acetylneuraminic acid mutarotase